MESTGPHYMMSSQAVFKITTNSLNKNKSEREEARHRLRFIYHRNFKSKCGVAWGGQQFEELAIFVVLHLFCWHLLVLPTTRLLVLVVSCVLPSPIPLFVSRPVFYTYSIIGFNTRPGIFVLLLRPQAGMQQSASSALSIHSLNRAINQSTNQSTGQEIIHNTIS